MNSCSSGRFSKSFIGAQMKAPLSPAQCCIFNIRKAVLKNMNKCCILYSVCTYALFVCLCFFNKSYLDGLLITLSLFAPLLHRMKG